MHFIRSANHSTQLSECKGMRHEKKGRTRRKNLKRYCIWPWSKTLCSQTDKKSNILAIAVLILIYEFFIASFFKAKWISLLRREALRVSNLTKWHTHTWNAFLWCLQKEITCCQEKKHDDSQGFPSWDSI